MKLVIAIIQSSKLDTVMKALDEKEIYLKTVSTVLGCGRQKGVSEIYRGVREAGNLLKKVRLEIGVNDEYLEKAIEAITKAAQTGKIIGVAELARADAQRLEVPPVLDHAALQA